MAGIVWPWTSALVMLLRLRRFVPGGEPSQQERMGSRRKIWAAARWILLALIFGATGSAPPLFAQPETNAPVVEAAPAVPAAAPQQVPAAPPQSVPTAPPAVFDAPGMPGVRHMAPIPDRPRPDTTRESTTVPGGQQVVPAQVPPAPPNTQPSPGAVVASPPAPVAPIPGPPVTASIPAPQSAPTPVAAPRPAATSNAGRSLLAQTVAAAKGGEWSRARRLAGETGNKAAALLVEWLYLTDRGSDASFVQASTFLNAHPNWPRRDALIVRAEEAMPTSIDPRLVIEWYGERTPITATGLIRLGEALLAAGSREKGVSLIRKAWVEESLSASEEAAILQAHGYILREADHRARLDQRLALDDVNAARRQISRVDGNARRVAEARLRLKSNPAGVAGELAALPRDLHDDRGLLQDASRAYRSRGQTDQALRSEE